jgi:hypothetical protein
VRGLHFEQNRTAAFARKLTAILAMSALIAFNFAPLEATATTTVVNCSGGGNFAVSPLGGEVYVGGGSACSGTAVIPAEVTQITDGAFYNANSMTAVTFASNSSLTTIGSQAFQSSGLTSITLPDSLISIGNSAFFNSNNLTSVNFGSGSQLTTLGTRVFESNAQTTVALPATVTTIGSGLFGRNARVTIDPANTNYSIENGVLFNKNRTTLISYASWLTDATYVIPASVTTIASSAFSGSRLQSINIPASVSSFGSFVFMSSSQLTSITFAPNSSLSSFPFGAFSGIPSISLTLSASPYRSGYRFTGWSTTQNGTALASPTTTALAFPNPPLFALWEVAPTVPAAISKPSEPVGPRLTIDTRIAVSTNGQSLALQGLLLSEIQSVKLDGKEMKVIKQTDNELVIEVPPWAEGFPDLQMTHAGGVITHHGMIQVIKPYELTRSIKITKFVGSRPTVAGLSALYKLYRDGKTANILTCVMTVASDASAEQISNAEYLAKETCQRVVRVSKHIKTANIQIQKDGAAGSKPALTITFDRTLGAGRG